MNQRKKTGLVLVVIFGAFVAGLLSRDDEPAELPPRTEIECLAPVGPVASYGEFRWSYPLPEGGSYELRLYDSGYTLLGSLGDITEPTWTADAALAEQLPDELTWEIFARDAEGADLSNGRAEAQRQ